MKGIIATKKKQVHSDWTLMQCHYDQGKFFVNIADQHSDDQVRFWLEPEDVQRLQTFIARAPGNQPSPPITRP